MLKKVGAFLNQPYPDSDGTKTIAIGGFLAGLIVFLILVLLQPFGMSDISRSMDVLYSLCIGIITFLIVVSYELIQKHLLKIKKDVETWTLWKWIVNTVFMIFLIAIANYMFIIFLFDQYQGIPGLMASLYSTFIIAIFPTMLIGSLNVIRHLKANQNVATSIALNEITHSEPKKISIPIKDSEKTIEINPSEILYAEAMQNYVLIFLWKDGDVKKETVRNTFSNVAATLRGTSVMQCHRSYLVNSEKIESITGNAQGLKVKLKEIPNNVIPVSRKYIPAFKAL